MRGAALLLCCATAAAQTEAPASAPAPRTWEIGAVLDVAHTSRMLALGQRDQGLALGHSDVSARGPLGAWFNAQLGASAHQHDGKLEAHIEEAWLQTRSLPAGLQLRAGRFASQIGYLNEQHPHADDFVERPLLYRAFLGGHWFDDGLRVNWTAPTPLYLRFGAEVFRGRQLVEEAAAARRPGALTLSAKLGGDIGANHSWQLGAAYLHNRREAAVEDEEAEGGEGSHDHAHGHNHAHGASFSGRKNWYFDAAWKWAPDGNNRQQQLKVVGELAQITDLNRFADSDDRHRAASVSVVWRFRQDFEVGARTDWLRVRMPHGDHFHSGRLAEDALMVAWKPSHMQALRLQFTAQRDAKDFDDVAKRAVQLQYVLAFGAHGAHSF